MYSKVYVEITNVCNMSCSFCHGHKRPPREMSIEEFKLILSKLKGHTNYIYYHLMGEPLTHPLLPDFLRLAAESGYKSIITTNGTLLKKHGSELLYAGVHKVNVSLHSFEDGTKEAETKYLSDVADFVNKAAKTDTVVVMRLWNNGFDGGRNVNVLSFLKSAVSGEWTETARGIRIKGKIFLEYGERFTWPDKDLEVTGERYFCYGLKDQFGILSDGTVVPCCLDSDGVISLGNVFKEDVSEILSSERARAIVDGFRSGRASEELCKRCGYAQRFV